MHSIRIYFEFVLITTDFSLNKCLFISCGRSWEKNFPAAINVRKKAGIRIRVSIIDDIKPPMTVQASGDHKFAPSLRSIAIGTRPKTVVSTVKSMGLSLSLFDIITALRGLKFFTRI